MRFQPCLTQSANDWRWSQDWEATQAIPLTTIYLHKASATKDTTTTCLNINIRSAATGTLMVPRARTATGQRSFAVNRLATWNRLLPALVHYGHRIHRIASSSGHWRRPVLDHPASLRRPHDSSAGYKYPDLLTYLPQAIWAVLCTYISHLRHGISGLVILSNCIGTRTSKHDQIQQRVGAESICAVHGDARRLTGTVQTTYHLVFSVHMVYHLYIK